MSVKLAEKVAVTFVVSFLGIFVPGVAGLADTLSKGGDWNAARTALVSLVLAAVAAGFRGLVAFLPVLSSDNGIGVSKGPS